MNPNAMAFSFFTGNPFHRGRMDLTPGGQPPTAQGFGTVALQAADVPSGNFKAVYEMIAAANARSLQGTAATMLSPPCRNPAPPAAARDSDPEAALQVLLSQSGIPNQFQPSPATPWEAVPREKCGETTVKKSSGTIPDPIGDINELIVCTPYEGMIAVPMVPVTPAEPAGTTAPPLPAIIPPDGNCTDAVTIAELVSKQPGEQNGPAITEAASKLIGQALAEIAEAFHLSIDPGLENMSLSGASEEVLRRFSEVLYALKKIAGVLEDAAVQGRKLDTGTQIIDVAKAREAALFVQVRIFRIEIGLSMLGIGAEVVSDLAEKMEIPFDGTIPRAIDPAKMTMSRIQLEKLFGTHPSQSSPSIATLAEKIRELFAKFGGNGDAQVRVNAGVAARSETVTETIRTAQAGVVSPFDAQTTLKPVNRDVKALIAAENAEAAAAAARAERIDVSPGVLNAAAKSAVSGAIDAVTELPPPVDAGGKILVAQSFSGVETKTASPSYKTPDEAVMQQLSDRLHTALRSGSNEIRIQLRPESLGEVRLRIRVEGDIVFARIQVESQQVKQIVESNMQVLKDSLSQQHLQTGSLEVNVGGEGWDRKTEEQVHQTPRGGAGKMTSETEDEDGEDGTETERTRIGIETGRKFGVNTIEYFA